MDDAGERATRPRERRPRSVPVAAGLACLVLLPGVGVATQPSAPQPSALRPAGIASAVGQSAPAASYRWPVDGTAEVSRRFDPPLRRWLPGHRGVDLVAAPRAVVRAAGAGTVRFAEPLAGRGVVSVAHAGGLRTTYEPVTPVASAGDRVAAGDPIGVLDAGHAGCPAAACLHWGLIRGHLYLDPLTLLGLGRVRLLPRA